MTHPVVCSAHPSAQCLLGYELRNHAMQRLFQKSELVDRNSLRCSLGPRARPNPHTLTAILVLEKAYNGGSFLAAMSSEPPLIYEGSIDISLIHDARWGVSLYRNGTSVVFSLIGLPEEAVMNVYLKRLQTCVLVLCFSSTSRLAYE